MALLVRAASPMQAHASGEEARPIKAHPSQAMSKAITSPRHGVLWRTAESLGLALLAPLGGLVTLALYDALLVAVVPLPWGGTLPNAGPYSVQGILASIVLAAGWILAGACSLLAMRRGIRVIHTMPRFPQGEIAFRLASLAVALGAVCALIWVSVTLYAVVFLLVLRSGV